MCSETVCDMDVVFEPTRTYSRRVSEYITPAVAPPIQAERKNFERNNHRSASNKSHALVRSTRRHQLEP